MTWFKVDDGLAIHPKAVTAGNAAMGLWVRAGSWCSANLTDGALPAHMLGTLGAQRRDARRLVEVGLWCETEDGYRFKDWEQYQPSKVQVSADREAARERQRRHREQLRHGVTNAVTHAVTNAVSHRTPTRPDPSLGSGTGSQSSVGRTNAPPQRGDIDFQRIKNALRQDDAWTRRVIDQVTALAPANVHNLTAYVVAAIAKDPARYQPTLTAPVLGELCDEHGRARSSCPAEWHQVDESAAF